MIDLQKFCADETGYRYYLRKPSSSGNFTFATNGHIIVRVARRSDIPENKEFPSTKKVTDCYMDGVFMPPPTDVKIPASEFTEENCDECDGRGKEHDCPSCECECEECEGTGKQKKEKTINVRVGNAILDSKYIALAMALDGIEFNAKDTKPDAPVSFRFKEGIGMIMPRRVDKEDLVLFPAET